MKKEEELLDLSPETSAHFQLIKDKKREVIHQKNLRLALLRAVVILLSVILFLLIAFIIYSMIVKQKVKIIEKEKEASSYKELLFLGQCQLKLISAKISYDKKYIIGIEKNTTNQTQFYCKIIDRSNYTLIPKDMVVFTSYKKFELVDYIPLPKNRIAVIERITKQIDKDSYAIEQIAIYNYTDRYIGTTQIIELRKRKVGDYKEEGLGKPIQIFYKEGEQLIVNIEVPNEPTHPTSKYIVVYSLNSEGKYVLKMTREYPATHSLKIITLTDDYLVNDIHYINSYSEVDPETHTREYKYYYEFLDVNNNFKSVKEIARTAKTDDGYLGDILKVFNYNDDLLLEISEDRNNFVFYNLRIDIYAEEFKFVKNTLFGSIDKSKQELDQLIKYNETYALFSDTKGKMELFSFDTKVFRTVYLDYFNKNIKSKDAIDNIENFFSLDGRTFIVSFKDGFTRFYAFEE